MEKGNNMGRKIKYTVKQLSTAIIVAIVLSFSFGYVFGIKEKSNTNDELTLLRESNILQDSAMAFATLIMPESANYFDSSAIYSRIDKKYQETFRFNYEDTIKNGIKKFMYVKNRIQILKILKPFYIKKVKILKDDDIYNVTFKMKTISFQDVLKYLVLKDTNYTYDRIYTDTDMSLNYKKKGGKFYFVGFNY